MAAPPSAVRRPPSIQWHRIGRVALLVVLGVILLLYIRPVTHWVQQRGTAEHSREDLQRLREEHRRLDRRLRQLTGPAAIEAEARKMGMVKQGERAYVIESR